MFTLGAVALKLHKMVKKIVEMLINKVADVNSEDINGITSLHWGVHSLFNIFKI